MQAEDRTKVPVPAVAVRRLPLRELAWAAGLVWLAAAAIALFPLRLADGLGVDAAGLVRAALVLLLVLGAACGGLIAAARSSSAAAADAAVLPVADGGRPATASAGAPGAQPPAGAVVEAAPAPDTAPGEHGSALSPLLRLAVDWYWEIDDERRITRIIGRDAGLPPQVRALLGRGIDELAVQAGIDDSVTGLVGAQLAQQAELSRQRLTLRLPGADPRYLEVSAMPRYEGRRHAGYRGVVLDVTGRESLLERITDSEQRLRALTDLATDWIWELDAALRFRMIRGAPRRGAAFGDPSAIGRHPWELPGEPVAPASWAAHKVTLEARAPFRDLVLRRRRKDGSFVYHAYSGDPVVDRDGAFAGYRGVGKDITEQVRVQQTAERLASLDPLTQLPNRQAFDVAATAVLSDAYASGRSCALLYVDLDDFRLLNNGYGHRVGDQMLTIVASRIASIVGPPHLLGRRGGDELVALLVDIPNQEFAVEVAERLIKTISEPARTLGMEVAVSPSIGVAYFPANGIDLDQLLNAADAAMYQAKEHGRNNYALYTQTVARHAELRLRLEQRLRRAVETRDFRLFYQPLVSMVDGKIIGAEALIRWRDAELGDIPPAEFIPIAEESGLIVQLGHWVLSEACRARRMWHQIGLDLPPLSINVSSVQLRQRNCVEGILGVLSEYGVAPSEIEVEVTETGLLDTTALPRENLLRLRNAGVKTALDDFGVGFSSLAHLRDLPIQRLKIDRSFTVECMRDARTLTIVKAVVEMARSLGLNVTAEGIETQAQQTWMLHLGCDSAQGYLFARPMTAEDFLRMFLDRRGRGGERSLMH